MKRHILQQLREYIQNARTNGTKTYDLSVLEKIGEDDIIIGEQASCYFARIHGNATGEGTSYFQNTTTRRTVNMDFTSPEYLFVKGHEQAAKYAMEMYYLQEGQTLNYYTESLIDDLTYMAGFKAMQQNMSDLNFSAPGPFRINRSQVIVTNGPLTFPLRPILAKVSPKEKLITLGYVYEKEGTTYIYIEPSELPKDEKSGSKKWRSCLTVLSTIWILFIAFFILKEFVLK